MHYHHCKVHADAFRFVWKTSSDALVGPFTPLLYVPLPVAQHFLGIASAIGQIPDFPPKSRETAILATGSHFGAVYEIYAHERVAEKTTELSRAQIKTITAGQKPLDLDEQSSAAFDVAIALSKGGGSLGDALFEKAKQHFGLVGAQALIQYVIAVSRPPRGLILMILLDMSACMHILVYCSTVLPCLYL